MTTITELRERLKLGSLHSISKEGGGGKSKFNHTNIDIYTRFEFNIKERKGIATSIFNDKLQCPDFFSSQGLIIYNGQINNVNRSDAGSSFNDDKEIWETPEGFSNPTINQVLDEIAKVNSYAELNIYGSYTICGIFIDVRYNSAIRIQIQTLTEFYEQTKAYDLPYYGFTDGGLIKINPEYLIRNDWNRIGEGTLITVDDIYNGSKVI